MATQGKDRKITVTLKAIVGDQVLVRNYRKRPAEWERGEVYNVDVAINKNMTLHTSYRVRLARESWSPKYGGSYKPIFVTVGDDAIIIQQS